MYQLVSIFILLIHNLAFASKPGSASQLLDSKTIQVRIYLSELHKSNSGEVTGNFIFIPGQIETKCQENKLSKCQELANCWQFPVEQRCQENLSDCKTVVRKNCIPYGFTINDEKVVKDKPPYSLLNAHLSIKDITQLKTLLNKWKLSSPPNGKKIIIEKLTQLYSTEAIVTWEHWGNGESYKINELIP
jgi:hypothetical protein